MDDVRDEEEEVEELLLSNIFKGGVNELFMVLVFGPFLSCFETDIII